MFYQDLFTYFTVGHNLKNITHADDKFLMADSEKKLQELLDNTDIESKKEGLSYEKI